MIGGSLGAIPALQEIVRDLPSDFGGSIFVAVHMASESPSTLPNIISRSGSMKATHPLDGESVEPGRIYVAPPDHHLTIEPGSVRVVRGPRENRHRPAIDPLFRTAARTYGSRVVGVVLSGRLDDGSAGLLAVKRRGGVTIVQDPRDAEAAEMPERAIQYVGPEHVLPSNAIGTKLLSLIKVEGDQPVMVSKNKHKSSGSASGNGTDNNLQVAYPEEGEGTPSVFACPECHGVLWELKDHDLVRFRCRVGHSYTMASLSLELNESSEAALWAAMRALEEKAAMNRRLAEFSKSPKSMAARLLDQAESDDASAKRIREMIFQSSGEGNVQAERSKKTGT